MPTKLVVDCSTGAVEEIELTAEEIAEMELAAQQAEEQKAREEEEKAAKETARAEIAARLGLSAEELSTLLS